jgi:hypothetical protein
LTFKRSGSGYRISLGGQSARAWWMVREELDSPGVLHVLREFLGVFRLIHFVGGFLLHEVRGRSVLECRTVCGGANGPQAHRGRSAIEGAVLEVRGCFSDSPPYPRGRSAVPTRTVRPEVANSPCWGYPKNSDNYPNTSKNLQQV